MRSDAPLQRIGLTPRASLLSTRLGSGLEIGNGELAGVLASPAARRDVQRQIRAEGVDPEPRSSGCVSEHGGRDGSDQPYTCNKFLNGFRAEPRAAAVADAVAPAVARTGADARAARSWNANV